MTHTRSIAIICIYCLVFTGLCGELRGQSSDTTGMLLMQIEAMGSLAADSTGGALNVPNVFSPNGDEINDYFEVTTDGTTVYEFTVFTRSGTRIYHSLSTRIFWDGKSIGGEDLSEGIYYYVIEETGDSDPFESAGMLYLFR